MVLEERLEQEGFTKLAAAFHAVTTPSAIETGALQRPPQETPPPLPPVVLVPPSLPHDSFYQIPGVGSSSGDDSFYVHDFLSSSSTTSSTTPPSSSPSSSSSSSSSQGGMWSWSKRNLVDYPLSFFIRREGGEGDRGEGVGGAGGS